MKKILLIITVLILALSAAAQEKCELPVSDAPGVFGLKLGMSPLAARRAGGGKLGIKDKPESAFFQNYIKKSPPAALTGVRALYLRFFDSKLYQIEVFYEKKNENPTLEEFVEDLSERENLPGEFWKVEYGIAELNCDGFSIVADNFLNPRIELTDQIVRKEFENAKKKAKEVKESEKTKN